MKKEWYSSRRILPWPVLVVFLSICLGLLLASADLAPGQYGFGSKILGEDTPIISVNAPEGFALILSDGTNNDTSKTASITVTDYSKDVYLMVHDASPPSEGEAGHMYSATTKKSLEKPLWIGEKDTPASMVALGSNPKVIYTFNKAPGTVTVALDFGQATGYSDPPGNDYAITVAFTAGVAA
jgi:hypothetical protein